jgi:hypothetical protein
MKIRPVGAELLHAGGGIDWRDKANSRVYEFCEGVWKVSAF